MIIEKELELQDVEANELINGDVSQKKLDGSLSDSQDKIKDTEVSKETTTGESEDSPQVEKAETVNVEKAEYENLLSVKKIADEEVKRARADALNFRKRVEKEKRSFLEFATGNILSKLLVISDDVERLLENAKEQISETHYDAIKSVQDRIKSIYDEEGVALIKIRKGKTAFDPRYHEAVVAVPSDEHPQNIIIDITTNGFVAGEKVLRPAKVVITKPIKQGKKKTSKNEA